MKQILSRLYTLVFSLKKGGMIPSSESVHLPKMLDFVTKIVSHLPNLKSFGVFDGSFHGKSFSDLNSLRGFLKEIDKSDTNPRYEFNSVSVGNLDELSDLPKFENTPWVDILKWNKALEIDFGNLDAKEIVESPLAKYVEQFEIYVDSPETQERLHSMDQAINH